jgi:hypothetical protein
MQRASRPAGNSFATPSTPLVGASTQDQPSVARTLELVGTNAATKPKRPNRTQRRMSVIALPPLRTASGGHPESRCPASPSSVTGLGLPDR